jgi:ribosome-associated protein
MIENPHHLPLDKLLAECTYTATRSSGPGGQNVNKVNTKVNLSFDLAQSECLTPEQKELVAKKLSSKLTSDGLLLISAQEKRSQLANKQLAQQKLIAWLNKALTKPKKRTATKPTKASKEKRIQSKKIRAEVKKSRKGNW